MHLTHSKKFSSCSFLWALTVCNLNLSPLPQSVIEQYKTKLTQSPSSPQASLGEPIQWVDLLSAADFAQIKKDPTLRNDWLKKTCHSPKKTTCDFLIILNDAAQQDSKSNQTFIDLKEFQKMRCLPDCKGIFEAPLQIDYIEVDTKNASDHSQNWARTSLDLKYIFDKFNTKNDFTRVAPVLTDLSDPAPLSSLYQNAAQAKDTANERLLFQIARSAKILNSSTDYSNCPYCIEAARKGSNPAAFISQPAAQPINACSQDEIARAIYDDKSTEEKIAEKRALLAQNKGKKVFTADYLKKLRERFKGDPFQPFSVEAQNRMMNTMNETMAELNSIPFTPEFKSELLETLKTLGSGDNIETVTGPFGTVAVNKDSMSLNVMSSLLYYHMNELKDPASVQALADLLLPVTDDKGLTSLNQNAYSVANLLGQMQIKTLDSAVDPLIQQLLTENSKTDPNHPFVKQQIASVLSTLRSDSPGISNALMSYVTNENTGIMGASSVINSLVATPGSGQNLKTLIAGGSSESYDDRLRAAIAVQSMGSINPYANTTPETIQRNQMLLLDTLRNEDTSNKLKTIAAVGLLNLSNTETKAPAAASEQILNCIQMVSSSQGTTVQYDLAQAKDIINQLNAASPESMQLLQRIANTPGPFMKSAQQKIDTYRNYQNGVNPYYQGGGGGGIGIGVSSDF